MEEALQKCGGLSGFKKVIPGREELASEAKLFQVLSDPTRLQILHSLTVIDLCPCILREITGLTDSKLSYHLSILEKEGLVKSSPRHRWRIYIITDLGRSLV
jgi:ArsR family transcriptional regulator